MSETRPGISELFRKASSLHQQGQIDAAEPLYRKVLKLAPNHAPSLHFLGVLMAQRGKLEIAAELIGRAITADPADPSAYFNRGTVLAGLKRWNEAVGCYDS